MTESFPKLEELVAATLLALKDLGGSGSNEEIHDWVAEHLRMSSELRDAPHSDGRMTKVRYDLHWARTYLKKFGAVDNSERGIWTLTDKGETLIGSDPKIIVRAIRAQTRASGRTGIKADQVEIVDVEEQWTDQLLGHLKQIKPDAFERLCQRVLRESGFVKVEVTGRSGDGGIDGIGVLRVNLVSFHVLFQSKRWKDSVGPSVVRDFRGAMVGRADKGLIITTGVFTAEARREATRDGAPAIDLVDGEGLCGLLKQLKLGVTTKLVEQVEINAEFFQAI